MTFHHLRPRWPTLLLALLFNAAPVAAQEPAVSEAQRARALQVELNACDYTQRRLRQTLAEELRQALERAEAAEQRAKKLEAALAAKLPSAPVSPGDTPVKPQE